MIHLSTWLHMLRHRAQRNFVAVSASLARKPLSLFSVAVQSSSCSRLMSTALIHASSIVVEGNAGMIFCVDGLVIEISLPGGVYTYFSPSLVQLPCAPSISASQRDSMSRFQISCLVEVLQSFILNEMNCFTMLSPAGAQNS